MSNKIGLVGMVVMCLFFYKQSLAKISSFGNDRIENIFGLEVQDTPEAPVVVFGKPHDLTQCAGPALADPATFYLPDALKGQGSNIQDPTGNLVDIVPFGYRYSFHTSQSDAQDSRDALTGEKLWVKIPRDGVDVAYFVRVYSVLDPQSFMVSEFSLIKTTADCTVQDYMVSPENLYQSVSSEDQAADFNLASNANRALLGNIVEYDVKLFHVDNSGNKTEIVNTNKAWESYSAKNNTIIEIQATDVKGGSTDVGAKQFVLYTEYLQANLLVDLVANQSNNEIDPEKREGIFNLENAKDSIAKGTGIYGDYLFVEYYKDSARKQKIEDPTSYTATDGSKVYTRISNLLFNAKPVVVKNGVIELKIVSKPIIGAFENLTKCTDALSEWRFDLLTLNQDILGNYPPANAQGDAGYTVAYFDTEQQAIDNENPRSNSLNVEINQIVEVWVRLTDLETGNFNHTNVTASLGFSDLITNDYNQSYCFSDLNQNTVDLYAARLGITGANINNEKINPWYPDTNLLDVLYYENQVDAQNNTNALSKQQASNYPLTIGQEKQLYTRVVMTSGFACQSMDYGTLKISGNLRVVGEFFPKQDILQLCSNGENQGAVGSSVWFEPKDALEYKVNLYRAIEDSNIIGTLVESKIGSSIEELTFELTEPGRYWLRAEYANNPYPNVHACGISSSHWLVKPVFEVIILNADATNMINSFDIDERGRAFVEIGVSVSDDADFEYAIDNGAFQPYNRFENVPIGNHVAWVRSKSNGCAVMQVFSVFGYPKFFTPNGDGYNDTWNIPGLSGHPEARITIFDRNGKLLKQMSPNNNQGWDGTFNGRELPSTDYWFSVEFTNDLPGNDELNGRQVKYTGHFSLKR